MNKLKYILSAVLLSGTITVSPALAADTGNTGESKEGKVFSGVYKDHQLIPNTMATLCEMSAEEAVADNKKLRNCVNSLALKRRSPNAETAREGLKDLQSIKLDQLLEMISLATAKGAAVADYYAETAKETSETNANAKTTADVDSAAINTSAVLTSVANSLRDLYVEQLKYLAISNIENIERDVLEDVASLETINAAAQKEKEQSQETAASAGQPASDGNGSADVQHTESTLTEESPATQSVFVDGVCRFCTKGKDGWECREEQCKDGIYTDANNSDLAYKCEKGICEKIEETAEKPKTFRIN